MSIEKLSIENISFTNQGQKYFEGISFDLPMNKSVNIYSSQGGGKSVLLKMLAGLMMPDKGRLVINGESFYEKTFSESVPYRLSVGYSFDYAGLIQNKTIYENLALPLFYHRFGTANEIKQRLKYFCDLFSLASYQDRRPALVSGSVRKTAVVVRSLIFDPSVLVLDDPTVGLKPQISERFINYINIKRREGVIKHIYFTSSDDTFLDKMSDTTLVLYRDKIVENEKVEVA